MVKTIVRRRDATIVEDPDVGTAHFSAETM